MNERERVFSVIIVNWNAKAFLDECLQSLARSDCADRLEIIVVDNASEDGSPELVEAKYPSARVIRNSANLGFAAANNIGIARSTGEYVFLVNSDVNVAPDCMETLARYMDARPEVGLSGPAMLGPDGKIGRSCRGFPTLWRMICHALFLDRLFPWSQRFSGYTMWYWKQDSTREVDILGGWFLCARRTALEKVGGLDERFFFYAEDMDWCRRFHLNGFKLAFVAEAQSVHYGGGSSRVAPVKYYIQEQRADLQLWRKHNPSWKCALYFLVCIVHQATRCVVNTTSAILTRNRETRGFKARRNGQCLLWYLRGARE